MLVGSLAIVVATTSIAPSFEGAGSPSESGSPLGPTRTPTATTESSRIAQEALQTLNTVPLTSYEADGYFRDAFGQRWADTDRNGCDTRNDILARDLDDPTFKPGTRDCVVLSGVLRDDYSGTVISFSRGQGTSEEVQIDHVISLAWAWRNGAAEWTDFTRTEFANDPINLRAIDGPTNTEKSDLGPGDWLPSNTAFRCDYAILWVEVLAEYELSIPLADKRQLLSVLASC